MQFESLEQSTQIISEYPAHCQPLGPLQHLGNAGGLSGARLIAYDAPCGRLLLRSWPADMPQSRLQQIHTWVLELANHIQPVAAPLKSQLLTTFTAHAGRLHQLEPWKPGRAISTNPGPIQVEVAASTLASVHRTLDRLQSVGVSPSLAHRMKLLRSLRDGGLDQLAMAINASEGATTAELAREWILWARGVLEAILARLAPHVLVPRVLQPCLRDCRADHWLFQDEQLQGLIDFGAMDLESVAFDLARLQLDWWPDSQEAGFALTQAYCQSYRLPDSALELIPVLEQSTALLAGANWTRWAFAEHRVFESSETVASGLGRSLRWMRSRLSTV